MFRLKHRAVEAPEVKMPLPLLQLLRTCPPEDREGKHEFEERLGAAWEVFRAQHPFGLKSSDLNFALDAADDIHVVSAEKLLAAGQIAPLLEHRSFCTRRRSSVRAFSTALLSRFGGEAPDVEVPELAEFLKRYGHDLRLGHLSQSLSLAEIGRLVHEQEFIGNLEDDVYVHPLLAYVNTIRQSTWHWCTGGPRRNVQWSRIVQFHNLLRNFDFAIDGFTVTIDHSPNRHSERGYAAYTGFRCEGYKRYPNTWLDGEIGLIVSRGEKHLMTIGVCPTDEGLLVNQIQLKCKKGNRWLYKLPQPYFQYVVGRLLTACENADLPMFLATGESVVNVLRSVHNQENPLHADVAERLRQLYDQPLGGLLRSPQIVSAHAYDYQRVTRVAG